MKIKHLKNHFTVKYLGPTNTIGARFKLEWRGLYKTESKIISRDYEMNPEDQMNEIAISFIKSNGGGKNVTSVCLDKEAVITNFFYEVK